LKEGVKIHVSSKFKRSDASVSGSGSAAGVPHTGLLAPPPATVFTKLAPPPSAAPVGTEPQVACAATGADMNDDGFGDFEG